MNDDTKIYQGIRLLCRNDQGFSNPTTKTRATFFWFPEDTSTTFQVAKIHARRIKVRQKDFIELIPYDEVNPDKIRQNRNCYNSIDGIENKLKRFEVYPETEITCKYKTQYSKLFVEYKKSFDMKTGKFKKLTQIQRIIVLIMTKTHTSQ